MATRLIRSSSLTAIHCLRNPYKFVGRNGKIASSFHTTSARDKNVDFHLSDIGEGIREVSIKEWFVKEGDTVEQFDNLCEVQSDKASVTITSRYDGKIVKLYHNIDDIALVGKPLVAFDVDEDDSADTPVVVQDEAVNVSTNISVNKPEKLVERVSPVEQLIVEKVSTLNVRDAEGRHIVLTTPAVRRIAIENNVDLKRVTPTGKQGRVLKSDVLEYLNIVPSTIAENKPTPVAAKVEEKRSQPKLGTVSVDSDRVEVLKGVRKMMFKSMTETLKIPHFAYSDEVDVTKLVQLRLDLKPEAEALGVKLTFMPFFIKAASLALLQYPILNSSLDVEKESVIYKSAHNISVAMATPDGLVVPNIKNCESKTILEIATDLNSLQVKGQKGQLKPDDFANGTFSLSNIGVIGGTYTHPCIMAPQVSIGAIGTTKIVPRFGVNDAIVKAHLVHVSWCADHRVIDGVTMANFSNAWKKYVENPLQFILQ